MSPGHGFGSRGEPNLFMVSTFPHDALSFERAVTQCGPVGVDRNPTTNSALLALVRSHAAAALLARLPALGSRHSPVAVRVDPIEARYRALEDLLAGEISLFAEQVSEQAMAAAMHGAHRAPARPLGPAGMGLIVFGTADIAVAIAVEPREQRVRTPSAPLRTMLKCLVAGDPTIAIAVEHPETAFDIVDNLLTRHIGTGLVARSIDRLGKG